MVAAVTNQEGNVEASTCIPIPAMAVMEQTVGQFERMSRVHEFWVTLSLPNPNGGPPLKKINMEDGETSFFVEPEFF